MCGRTGGAVAAPQKRLDRRLTEPPQETSGGRQLLLLGAEARLGVEGALGEVHLAFKMLGRSFKTDVARRDSSMMYTWGPPPSEAEIDAREAPEGRAPPLNAWFLNRRHSLGQCTMRAYVFAARASQTEAVEVEVDELADAAEGQREVTFTDGASDNPKGRCECLGYFEIPLLSLEAARGSPVKMSAGPFQADGGASITMTSRSTLTLRLACEGKEDALRFLSETGARHKVTDELCDLLDTLTAEGSPSSVDPAFSEERVVHQALAICDGDVKASSPAAVPSSKRAPLSHRQASAELRQALSPKSSRGAAGSRHSIGRGKGASVALEGTCGSTVAKDGVNSENAALREIVTEQQGHIESLKQIVLKSQALLEDSVGAATTSPPFEKGAMGSSSTIGRPRSSSSTHGAARRSPDRQYQPFLRRGGIEHKELAGKEQHRVRRSNSASSASNARNGSCEGQDSRGGEFERFMREHKHACRAGPQGQYSFLEKRPEGIKGVVVAPVKPPAQLVWPKNARRAMTDDDIRFALRKHYQSLSAALRGFDQDGDALVSFPEFKQGLNAARLNLPDEIIERLWKEADDDALGFLSMGRLAAFLGDDPGRGLVEWG